MTLTSPLRLHRHPTAEGRSTSPPAEEEHIPRVVGVGLVQLGSAARYLFLWMLVLLGVEVLVFWVGYTLLSSLGVLESVSAAAATVLGEQVPDSGVLPALELPALLPWAVLVGAALSVLWLVMSLSLLLVHNCICRISGGPRVQLR